MPDVFPSYHQRTLLPTLCENIDMEIVSGQTDVIARLHYGKYKDYVTTVCGFSCLCTHDVAIMRRRCNALTQRISVTTQCVNALLSARQSGKAAVWFHRELVCHSPPHWSGRSIVLCDLLVFKMGEPSTTNVRRLDGRGGEIGKWISLHGNKKPRRAWIHPVKLMSLHPN